MCAVRQDRLKIEASLPSAAATVVGVQSRPELNGAEVLDCAVVGPEATTVDVEVGIDLPPSLSVFGQTHGRSRAGAPPRREEAVFHS